MRHSWFQNTDQSFRLWHTIRYILNNGDVVSQTLFSLLFFSVIGHRRYSRQLEFFFFVLSFSFAWVCIEENLYEKTFQVPKTGSILSSFVISCLANYIFHKEMTSERGKEITNPKEWRCALFPGYCQPSFAK